MPGLLKSAADSPLASSTGATAASPLPTPSIEPTPAPGKQGPRGLSPRQNYSRVNTGAPPQADAGASEQKSMPPRGAEMLPKRASVAGEELMGKMAGRPVLQDIVKAAMVDSASRVRVTEEARLQSEKTAEEKCSGCSMAKHAGPCPSKAASAVLSDQHATKLAAALDFLAEMFKEGTNLAGAHSLSEHLQTSPPGVSQATASKQLPDHKGEGVHTVPMHPGQQKAMTPERGATQMENTLDSAPQLHKKMMETNYGKKSASVVDMIRAKLAAEETPAEEKKEMHDISKAKAGIEALEKHEKKEHKEGSASLADYMAERVKQAEDAINPAKISAGPAVPPDTSASGQPGGQPVGGAPQGPTGLIASNEAAQHYTKGQSHGPRREDLKKYFDEPALSAEHDRVLQVAFENTGKAGPKIASAEPAEQPAAASVKTAAARVLLSKLAETAEAKNKEGAPLPGAA